MCEGETKVVEGGEENLDLGSGGGGGLRQGVVRVSVRGLAEMMAVMT